MSDPADLTYGREYWKQYAEKLARIMDIQEAAIEDWEELQEEGPAFLRQPIEECE